MLEINDRFDCINVLLSTLIIRIHIVINEFTNWQDSEYKSFLRIKFARQTESAHDLAIHEIVD